MHAPLPSESVVLSAPMSFHGSAARLWKLTRLSGNQLVRWLLLIPVALVAISVAWPIVLVWYVAFSALLIPYRLIRRGHRKDRQAALRHREMLGR